MALDWYQGEVIDIIKETHNIRRFYIRFNEISEYKFLSGQYVKIEFPIPSKKNYRQYSIASEPNGTNIIELLIILDPNGLATNYLFNEVKIGSFLKISEPRGNFLLPEVIEKDLCFISTGTGLAPLRSMYLDILKNNIPHKDIYIIFGTRFMKDLIYIDEFESLVKDFGIKYYPILSQENSGIWSGEQGYVHKIYKNLFSENKDIEFYICGWRDMVTQTRTNLLEMGYERRTIHFERYD